MAAREPGQGDWDWVRTPAAFLTALADGPMPRYVFFLNWSIIVPPAITERYECVNFHCTALPFGRGGHPIENLILRGVAETVITAYRMTSTVDAGPIYGVSPAVSLAGSKAQICARFVQPCAALIRWMVTTEPRPTPQRGEVIPFRRLSAEAYARVWQARVPT